MRILVNHNGQQLGPYTTEEARAALASGALAPTDLAWAEGTPAWVPLASLLAGVAPGGPPNLPGAAAPYAFPNAGAETSGLATTSLVLGALSFVCSLLTAVPAIVCGHIARSQIKHSSGRLKGEGLALAGLILGYIYMGVFLPITIAMMIPAVSTAMKDKTIESTSIVNARQIVQACTSYAAAHNGVYPGTLEELVPDYLPKRETLSDPMAKQPGTTGYDLPAAGKTPQNDEVVLIGKTSNKKGECVIGRANGAVTMEKFTPPGELEPTK